MFDKYEVMGAYHWRECDRSSKEFNPPLVARFEMIAQRIDGGSILDIGAGDGCLSGLLAQRSQNVVALEHDQVGVSLARKMLSTYQNIEVQEGSAYELPFADKLFDVVVMADVIEHLDHALKAATEAARVLKPDGKALITTPQKRPDRVWDHRHVMEYRPEELRDLLLQAFDEVDMKFCWPKHWMNFYGTKLGWRLLKATGRLGFNPFTRETEQPEDGYQMLAICRKPRRREERP